MKKYFVILTALLFSCSLLPALDYDFIPFQGVSKKIITKNFVIIYPGSYEETANETASYAEEIFTALSPFFEWDPWMKITIILTDHTDIPNGMAFPVPRSTIVLRLTPMDAANSLRDYDNPLYSLLLHEMAHALHLDQIRGGAWLWRVLYGRLYFPNVNAFSWYHEGTAVLAETVFAGGGRLDSHYNEAIVRSLANEKMIPSYARLVNPVVDFPHGQEVYHLGARFLEYLYDTYGEEKFRSFFTDQANDFFPFICEFVLKFKKIYGKPLKVLWEEWKVYEEEKSSYEVFNTRVQNIKLTDLKGRISALSIQLPPGALQQDSSADRSEQSSQGEPEILFSSVSSAFDSYLYSLPGKREVYDKKLEKVALLRCNSLSHTENRDFILYTKITNYPGGFEYYDIYSYQLSKKIEKRLTKKGRIHYLDFSQESRRGVFVKNLFNKATLYSAEFTPGSLLNIKEISLPSDFSYIGPPSLNDATGKVLFSARRGEDNYSIYLYDLESEKLEEIPSIKGKNPVWFDSSSFSFIGRDVTTDSLFSYNRANGSVQKLAESAGYILKGRVAGNSVYYVDYTYKGEELFQIPYAPTEYVYDFTIRPERTKRSAFDITDTFDTTGDRVSRPDFTSKIYNPLAYLYPTVWAFLPVQLNTRCIVSGIDIPVVGPQYMIYNRLPMGRFLYSLWVNLDYMKWYPQNGMDLTWKIPYLSISYSWRNWASGLKAYVFQDGSGLLYSYSLGSRYPIAFSNTLSISTSQPLLNFGTISAGASVSHQFDEFNIYKGRLTNTLGFSQNLSYFLNRSRSGASRWDRGFYTSMYAYHSPPILDNNWYYILKARIEGRVPVGSAFFFIDAQGGFDPLFQDLFTARTDMFRIGTSVLSTGGTSASTVDTKAFSTFILSSNTPSGAAFAGADIGFDISVYKRTHYWKFLTLGFKEFYIRPYGEFLYLYSRDTGNNFLADMALEFCLDLFMFYGNISINFVQGFAFGLHQSEYQYVQLDGGGTGLSYNPNMLRLGMNIYTYLSLGL